MAIPVTTITAAGCLVPAYEDIFSAYVAGVQAIYGTAINLDNDTEDGQIIGIVSQAVFDACNAVAAAYNSFSPSYAQGQGLSSVVKINGIRREIAQNSTVDLLITGTVGKTITNGLATDGINQWALPAVVVIPLSGSITVTATAVSSGQIAAAANTIDQISTPQTGWNSVNNPANANPGTLTESDGQLRQRQVTSTAQPAQTIVQGIQGSIASVQGVTRFIVYENDTNATNANGIPARCTAAVVEGGDINAIALAIALRKTLGSPTYGSTSVPLTVNGSTVTISLSRPVQEGLAVNISLHAGTQYTSLVAAEIQNAVANYVNSQGIGAVIGWSAALGAALLPGSADASTFRIESIVLGLKSGNLTQADYALAWNQTGNILPSDVNISVI